MMKVGMPRGVNAPRKDKCPSSVVAWIAIIMTFAIAWGAMIGIMASRGWRF